MDSSFSIPVSFFVSAQCKKGRKYKAKIDTFVSVSNVNHHYRWCGGTVFYIDNTADGTYTFYNAQGMQVAEPSVGTDCTGWTYEVTDATKDKYYICNSEAVFGADRTGAIDNPYIVWTYLDEASPTYTGFSKFGYYGRVTESLTFLYRNIGYGKNNTTAMMSIERSVTVGGVASTEKAYIQEPQLHYRGSTEYAETVWYVCDRFNRKTYMERNTTGCDDWYIPSTYELAELLVGFENSGDMLEFCYRYPYVFTSSVTNTTKVECIETDWPNYSIQDQPRYATNSVLVLVRSF